MAHGEGGKGSYLNGTRQTAAGEEEAAARASRPEVEAEAGWEAVAAVAMDRRARDEIWVGEVDGWRTRVSCRRVLPQGEPLVAFVFLLGGCGGIPYAPRICKRHAAAVALWPVEEMRGRCPDGGM